jgi:capsid protein
MATKKTPKNLQNEMDKISEIAIKAMRHKPPGQAPENAKPAKSAGLKSPKAQLDILANPPKTRQVRTSIKAYESENIRPSTLDRAQMISYARDAEENFQLGKGLVQRLTNFVVGTGNSLQFNTRDRNVTKDEKAAYKAAEDWFNFEYAEKENFDTRNRHALWEAQKTAFRRWYVDGDIIAVYDPVRNKFSHFEADQLATPPDYQSMAEKKIVIPSGYDKFFDKLWTITDGVLCDGDGAPVKYVVNSTSKSSPPLAECTGYDASIVEHVAEFHRFRMVRGSSQLVPFLIQMIKLSRYFDNDLTSTDIAARWALAIKRKNGVEMGDVNTGNDIDGEDDSNPGATSKPVETDDIVRSYDRLEQVSAGSIEYMEPGDEVQELGSGRPNQAFKDYVRSMVRIMSAGASVPLEVLMLDFSDSNFSSNKAALLMAWTYIQTLQEWFNRIYNRRIAIRSLEYAVRKKIIVLPPAWRRYVAFTSPGIPEVDRYKAEIAREKALATNTTTLKREISMQGGDEDWRDTMAQRHQERLLEIEYQKEEFEARKAAALPPDFGKK